jgi:hypothetical protein
MFYYREERQDAPPAEVECEDKQGEEAEEDHSATWIDSGLS